MTRILLVEPNRERRTHLREVLARNGAQIHEAIDLSSVAGLDRSNFDAAVANAELGGNPGIVLRTLLHAGTPLILYTEHGSVRCAVEALQQGATDYLVLPMEPDELLGAVRRCLRAARGADAHPVRSMPIVGHCDAIHELRKRIEEVARDAVHVLIHGEAGVGKELVARAIHAGSPRAHMPLISMRCPSLAPDSIEAELFGTGSEQGNLIGAAQGGTLFLDEIGELSASAQARLNDVLRSAEADVMLVATSYADLDALAAAGRFNAGLHALFAGSTLRVPPLRERGEDVVELANWLLPEICRRLSKPLHVLSDAALNTLRSYGWPGNVRELHNALERAVILCECTLIEPSLLAIGTSVGQHPASSSGRVSEADGETSLEGYFVKFVLEHQDELTETELAAKLGISRKSLWERRQRLNIPRRRTRRRGTRHDVEL